MSLSDPLYFVFLTAVFLGFHCLAKGMPRRVWLLAASYFFYFEFSHFYICVLLFVTLVAYHGAIEIGARAGQRNGTLLFWLVLLIAAMPLLALRYGAVLLHGRPGWGSLPESIPVGISFFSFVALGYLIDVYLEVIEPERDFSRVALLFAFFPVISAGPIERAGHFSPQLDCDAPFFSTKAFDSLRLIFIGLVLKLLFATVLEGPATAIIDSPRGILPLEQLAGVIVFAFYMYADFAGYTLIAIGSAGLFGLSVLPNFRQPFFSTTIPEFWRRWHMSLSFWVRDYLFIPLRTAWRSFGKPGMLIALLISFVTIGVWHGPRLSFLIFGLMHGILAITSSLTLSHRDAFWKKIRFPKQIISCQRMIATTFLFALTLVPFRNGGLQDTLYIYRSIFSMQVIHNFQAIFMHHGQAAGFSHFDTRSGLVILIIIPVIIIGDIMASRKFSLGKLPMLIQVPIYMAGLVEIFAVWMDLYVTHPFIYNKF
jgi:alginate O-acetyltransferase complex protein AlgI